MERIKVFISYCHRDASFLDRTSLYAFLEDLKQEGVEFLVDRDLRGGDAWETKLEQWMDEADVALLLISQAYLISKFCMTKEVPHLLERRERDGIRIFPILLSPCRYQTHDWLCSLQFLPSDNMTLEDYEKSAERKKQYLQITDQLRHVIANIREQRQASPEAQSSPSNQPQKSAKRVPKSSPTLEVREVAKPIQRQVDQPCPVEPKALPFSSPVEETQAEVRVEEKRVEVFGSPENPRTDSAPSAIQKPSNVADETQSFETLRIPPSDKPGRRLAIDPRVAWAIALMLALSATLFVVPSLSWIEEPALRGGVLELPANGRLRVLILPWRDAAASPAIREWRRALPTLLRVELQAADEIRLLSEEIGEEIAQAWNTAGWDGEFDTELLNDVRTQTGAHVILTGEFEHRPALNEPVVNAEIWSTGSGQSVVLPIDLPQPQEIMSEIHMLARNLADILEVDFRTMPLRKQSGEPSLDLAAEGEQFLARLDGQAALRSFESMLKKQPDDIRLRLGQAEALALLGYEDRSRQLTYQLVDHLAQSLEPERWPLLARVFELRRLFQAAAWLSATSWVEQRPPTPEDGLRQAMLQVRGGLLEEADATIEMLAAFDPLLLPEARFERVRAELERRRAKNGASQVEAAERALEAAQAQGVAGLFLAARAHLLVGWGFQAEGQVESARRSFEAAQAIFHQQNHLRGQADALLNLARLFTQESEFQEARHLYSEAQSLYDQLNNPPMMSRILLAMGYLRVLEGMPRLALETFERAGDRAFQAGDLLAEAHAWLGQAELLAIDGDFRAAERAHQTGQRILNAGGGHRYQPLSLLMQGWLWSLEGRLGDARRAFEDAYRKSSEAKDPSMKARAASFLGRTFYQYGQLEQARAFYQEGLDTFQGQKAERAEILVASADALLASGNLAQAEAGFESALETQQQLGIRPDGAQARAGLARLHFYSGSPERSAEEARLAWIELRETQHWLEAATVGGYLVRALAAKGDLKEARSVLDESQEWVQDVDALPVELSLVMARAELALATPEPNNRVDVRRDLEKAIAKAEGAGYRLMALEARLLLLTLQSQDKIPDRFRLDGIELEAKAMGFHLLVRQVQALKHRRDPGPVAAATFGT